MSGDVELLYYPIFSRMSHSEHFTVVMLPKFPRSSRDTNSLSYILHPIVGAESILVFLGFVLQDVAG